MTWADDHWPEILKLPLGPPMQRCAVPKCDREKRAKGLCLMHYKAARRRFDAEWQARERARRRAS